VVSEVALAVVLMLVVMLVCQLELWLEFECSLVGEFEMMEGVGRKDVVLLGRLIGEGGE